MYKKIRILLEKIGPLFLFMVFGPCFFPAEGWAKSQPVPENIERLRDKDSEIRREAAWQLGYHLNVSSGMPRPLHQQEEDRRAVAALITALADENQEVRVVAVEALGLAGSQAKEAMPSLIQSLQGTDRRLAIAAAEALFKIDPSHKEGIPVLSQILTGEDRTVRTSAARALGRIGPTAKESVPILMRSLSDADKELRSWAAWALGEVGPEAEEAGAALIDALKDEDKEVRIHAAVSLVEINGQAAREVLPTLMEALEEQFLSRYAAEALGKMGPAAKEAVPALIRALKHESHDTRSRAAEALEKIGTPEAQQALKTLSEKGDLGGILPSQKDPMVTREGVRSAITLREIPKLLQELGDRHPMVRSVAVYRLRDAPKEAAGEVVPALMKVFQTDPAPWIRISAAVSLANLGTSSQEAIPPLVQMLKDEEKDIRAMAAYVLGEIALSATAKEKVVPALVETLRDEDRVVRESAAKALEKLGPTAQEGVVTLFIQVLQSEDKSSRRKAARALEAIGPAASGAVPPLLQTLMDSNEDEDLRHDAAYALGKIGPAAVPALIQVLKEGEGMAPDYAVNALLEMKSTTAIPQAQKVQAALGQYWQKQKEIESKRRKGGA